MTLILYIQLKTPILLQRLIFQQTFANIHLRFASFLHIYQLLDLYKLSFGEVYVGGAITFGTLQSQHHLLHTV